MTDVACNLKPEPITCPCGCEKVGQPRKKVWAGETVGHIKGCACRRCVGGRQRSKARKRENRLAKATGGNRELLSGGVTGRDVTTGAGTWVEETAEKAITRGFFSWWNGKGVQAKTQRIRENTVAPWALVVWDGAGHGFVVQRVEDWADREQA